MLQHKVILAKWTTLAAAVVYILCSAITVGAQSCPVGGFAMPACPINSDKVIQDQIISRLSGSIASKSYPVMVSVQNGVVRLWGMVQTSGIRDLANLFAWSVRGVIDVQNCLTIDPKTADDLILIGEVRHALNKSAIDAKKVSVRASDGVVELTGTVSSDVAREAATGVTSSVPGVTAVYNNISVYGPD